MNSNSQLEFTKQIVEMVVTYTKWGTTVVGGLCLLIYSNEIGQFPEGINLGEGLAFYLMSVGFLIAYTIFAFGVTSLGSLLMAGPAIYIEYLRNKRSGLRIRSQPKINFWPMWHFYVICFGSIALLAWIFYTTEHPRKGFEFIALPITQGVLLTCLVALQAKLDTHKVGIILGSVNEEARKRQKKDASTTFRIFLAFLALFPIVFNPILPTLVDAAFRVAQLRKESATIHIKKPWSERLVESGLPPEKSFLGTDYAKFSKVKVLLRSVGTKVVIALPDVKGNPPNLTVPADQIEVE